MSLDKNGKAAQFLPNWPNSHAPKSAPAESTNATSIHEEYLDQVTLNEMQQGELYILKIKLIAVALFQGWDDDMCCFSILRTDLLEELRWSEARYLPNNFDAYLAFDYAGNPPIHLWTKQLRAVIPINWFNIFEEARHMQRQWNMSYWNPEPNAVMLIDNNQQQPVNFNGYDDDYLEIRELTEDEQQFDNNEDNDEQSNTIEPSFALNDDDNTAPQPSITKTIAPKRNLLLSELPTELDSSLVYPILSPVPKFTSPAMRLQNQYTRSTSDVPQQQQQQSTIEEKQFATKLENKPSKSENTQRTNAIPTRPEVKQRRSFSSFFLKKKKSKKSLNEDKPSKRKSTPPDVPTAKASTKQHQSNQHSELSAIEIPVRRKSDYFVENQNIEALESIQSNNSDTSDKPASSLSSPTIKTPKNDAIDISTTNKIELFDMENYFDMQATFAFLNNTNTDGFSLMNLSNTTTKTNA